MSYDTSMIRNLLDAFDENQEEQRRIVEMLAKGAAPPSALPVEEPDPVDPGDDLDRPATAPTESSAILVPGRQRPTEFEYIVRGNRVHDGQNQTHYWETPNAIAYAVRKGLVARARGDRGGPVSVGVEGPAHGGVRMGWGYDPNYDTGVCSIRVDGEWFPIGANLVGLNETAELTGLVLSDTHGWVDYLGLWDLGIRGGGGSHIVQTMGPIGNLFMDGCWWLRAHAFTGSTLEGNGMHIGHDYESLVWRRHEYKGCDLMYHSGYLKPGGVTAVQECNLLGGRRSGVQIRPHPATVVYGASSRPRADILIEDNFCDDFGWNHANPDGGAVISCWANPDHRTVIRRNVITNSRTSCLMVGWQPESDTNSNWVNANGFPHGIVELEGNTFENLNGDRPAVPPSAIELLRIFGGNSIRSGHQTLVLDSSTAAGWGAPLNGKVELVGEAAADLFHMGAVRWDRETQSHLKLTEAQLRDMVA